MDNSKNLSNKSLKINKATILLLILAFIGFLDALYLTIKHYTGGPVICRLTSGCEQVLTSKFAAMFGVPVALFGTIFYLLLMALILAYWESGNNKILKTLIILSTFGLIVSLCLLFLQVFVIKSLCGYCLISGIDSILIFVLAITMKINQPSL